MLSPIIQQHYLILLQMLPSITKAINNHTNRSEREEGEKEKKKVYLTQLPLKNIVFIQAPPPAISEDTPMRGVPKLLAKTSQNLPRREFTNNNFR